MTNIFKAYDIRGVYGRGIDKDVAYKLGRSFVLFLKKKQPKIVLGKDNRLSSPELFKYLKQGIVDEGGIVYDIGLSTTPMFYFADCFLKGDGGIMVTASHNPKQYNGFKIVSKMASPVSENSGLKDIKHIFENLDNNFNKKKGKAIKRNALKEYIKHISKDFNLRDFDFKIGIDTANAAPSILIDKIFNKTNSKIYHINKELDSNFPNHDPDPLQKKNLKQLINLIKDKKLDMGVAFDGDGDRIVFLDEKARIVSSDIILALLSDVLDKEVLYDLRCSNIVPEVAGNKAYKSRIGHSFIKSAMKKNNIFMGGEYSGHFYLNNKYCFEAPFFVLFSILEQMKLSSKKFSEIAKPYQKYFHSGEINFNVNSKEKILKEIEKRYSDGKKTKIDGLRIDYDDFWFLVRASNTEPVLRLIIEAKSSKLLKEKERELSKLIIDNK